MKKLILSAAILLGSLSAFAQTAPKQGNSTIKGSATESTMTPPQGTPSPTTQPQGTQSQGTQSTQSQGTQSLGIQGAVSSQTDGYTEIKTEELPVAVTDALKKSFPNAKLVKVNMNGQKKYKLDLEVGTKVGSLYVDETGKVIQK